MSPEPGPQITTTTACRLLGIHPDTLVRWEREGKITSTRTAGGHRRFDLADVDRLAAHRQPVSAASAATQIQP
jgi:putative resolvase